MQNAERSMRLARQICQIYRPDANLKKQCEQKFNEFAAVMIAKIESTAAICRIRMEKANQEF
jgi:hypothetical protein